MDLKSLREQAIREANDDFYEEKVDSFKADIKSIVFEISQNNAKIIELKERNKELTKKLDAKELEEFERVAL